MGILQDVFFGWGHWGESCRYFFVVGGQEIVVGFIFSWGVISQGGGYVWLLLFLVGFLLGVVQGGSGGGVVGGMVLIRGDGREGWFLEEGSMIFFSLLVFFSFVFGFVLVLGLVFVLVLV